MRGACYLPPVQRAIPLLTTLKRVVIFSKHRHLVTQSIFVQLIFIHILFIAYAHISFKYLYNHRCILILIHYQAEISQKIAAVS